MCCELWISEIIICRKLWIFEIIIFSIIWILYFLVFLSSGWLSPVYRYKENKIEKNLNDKNKKYEKK